MTDQPYVEVERAGRWTYAVNLYDGFMTIGPDGLPWLVLGRHRARRKAARELVRYLREKELGAQTARVEAGAP